MKVLVVEDDPAVAQSLELLLNNYNYAVDIVTDGEEALQIVDAFEYHLVLLDLLLPGLDGIEVCRQLRQKGFRHPILLLTGQGETQQKSLALNTGADDYVVKPFDNHELIARIQALLRRGTTIGKPVLVCGQLSLEPNIRKVTYHDQPLALTPKEYAILELFLRQPETTFSAKAILDQAWSSLESPGEEAVRCHIKELRHKLTAAQAPKDLIQTVYRVGYRLNSVYAEAQLTPVAQQPRPPDASESNPLNESLQATLEQLRLTQANLEQRNQELEQQLAQRTAELQVLYNQAPCGYHSLDIEGRILQINETELQMFGYTREEMIGRKITNFFTPDGLQIFQENYPKFLQQGWVNDLEFNIIRKEGSYLPISLSAMAVKDGAGNFLRSHSIVLDISERKRREANLAFLADIGETYARLSTVEEIIQAVGEKIGNYLQVVACNFSEIDQAHDQLIYFGSWQSIGESPLPDRICLSEQISEEFCRRAQSGEIIVSHNTQTTPITNGEANASIGALSFITVPFHSNGDWKYLFSIHDHKPRTWQNDEIELVQDLANRLFPRLERARSEVLVAADLRDTQRLHQLSTRITTITEESVLYDEILATAMALMHSDMGSLQILDQGSHELHLQSYQGFHPDAAAYWQRVTIDDGGVCGTALIQSERVIVSNIETCHFLTGTESLKYLRLCGIKAVQSTPLISRSGQLLGMFSTHWSQSYHPRDRELRFLDLLARQAADLIEHYQTQSALHHNQEMFSELVNNAPFGIYIVDSEFRLHQFNRGAEAVFSNIEPLIGRDFSTILQILWPEPFATEAIDRFRHTLASGESYYSPVIIESRANIDEIQAYDWQIHRIMLPDGNYGVVCYFYDLSEIKRTEAALLKNEELLQLAMAGAQAGSWDLLLATGEFSGSLETYTIYGLAPGTTVTYVDWSEKYLHPEDQAWVNDYVNQVILQRQSNLQLEFRILHPQKGVRWLLSLGHLTVNEQGEPIRLSGINLDITERKQAEIALEESRQQLQAILDHAPAVIYLIDTENRHLLVNRSYADLLATTPETLVGKSLYDVWPREIAAEFAAQNQRVLASKQLFQTEEVAPNPDGKPHTYLTVKFPLSNNTDAPYAVCGISTDITEQKDLEAQFYRAQRLESLGTLASGIAHDLNNALTPILSVAQLLRMKHPELDQRSQEMMQLLEDNARRGANMVKQILTFTRGTAGEYTPIEVVPLVHEVITVIQQTFPKSITIHEIMPTQAVKHVAGDPNQLHQVLMNLCVNARDAMPTGGTLTLSVENFDVDESFAQMHLDARVGQYVLITVTDTGTGIDPNLRELIFDPFFTTKPIGQGTGLGLSSALGIIRSYDGFIQVSSELGQGAQFRVYLPAIEAEAVSNSEEVNLLFGQDELVLVVDDEESILQSTRAILETYHYRVLTANSGAAAITIFTQHHPEIAVVLVDMMMPDMEGIALIRVLQEKNPHVRVIAVSGLFAQYQAGLEFLGIKTHLNKPYITEDLLSSIHRELEQ